MLLFFSFFRGTLGCCTCGWFCATLQTRLRSKPRSIEYMVLFECRVFSWKLSSKKFPYFVHVTFLVTSHWVPFVCRALVFFHVFSLSNQTGPQNGKSSLIKTWLIVMPNSLAFVLHVAIHRCAILGLICRFGGCTFLAGTPPNKTIDSS